MQNTIKLEQTLNKIPYSIKTGNFPLSKIKPKLIEGVQRGIPLFDNGDKFVSISDIDFITRNLETLNLFRGCTVGCTHCLKDAKPASKNNRSILFEDLIRFVDGFKNLNERLGFNALDGNKYLNIVDDSNPTDFPIKGLNGNHTIAEATKVIFENLRLPILFVTSGWNQKSQSAQNSANEIAKQFKENPQSLASLDISINPFSNIMEKSREALKSNDIEKANFYRKIYIDRMANTILTFWDLFKNGNNQAKIIYRHAGDYKGNELVGEVETKKLYIEIYEKLKSILGENLKEAPSLNPEVLTKFDKSHLIEPSGRARRYFPFDYNMNLQSELINESLKWNSMSDEEKKEFLRKFSLKCVDINGKIYSTFPAFGVHTENTPIEITVPTNIELNYRNRTKTPQIFSDIELD